MHATKMISNFLSTKSNARREAPLSSDAEATRPIRSFRDFYCVAHGLAHEQFVDHFLARALHLNARLLYPVAQIIAPDIDKADRELVSDLGMCQSRDEVRRILSRLPNYYSDWNFWRRVGKFRISSRRVLTCVTKYARLTRSAE
jgi:hypothetical protein